MAIVHLFQSNMSRTQINACHSVNLAINHNWGIIIIIKIIALNTCSSFGSCAKVRCTIFTTASKVSTNYRQRTRVNHATGAHNHAFRRKEVQIAAYLTIAHSINSTANANLAFHSIHQGIESRGISTSLEIEISNLISTNIKFCKSIQANSTTSLLGINMRSGIPILEIEFLHSVRHIANAFNARRQSFSSQPRRHGKANRQHGAQQLHAGSKTLFFTR